MSLNHGGRPSGWQQSGWQQSGWQQSGTATTAELQLRAHGSQPHLEHETELRPTSGIAPSRGRRTLDISVALLILGLTWPLLLALVIATRMSTGGSAVFRQRRVGQGGVPFTLYKFRTMRPGVAGPEVTAPGDSRVTRLGALLRRTSLDEIPQMVNVLLGHMTLVGPRPESVALARRYPDECKSVFLYRPGVTGPSQILVRDEKALRNATDVEQFYLRDLVPHRVATDLSFLQDPTVASTLRWLLTTALYLVGVIKPWPTAQLLTEPAPVALPASADE
jgi:lipopolysaccharide/colanic/teichoic acid biosynthesis glycosyltransferase